MADNTQLDLQNVLVIDIFDIYCSPYNRDPSNVDHPTSLVHSPTTKLCHFETKGFGTCDDDDQTSV